MYSKIEKLMKQKGITAYKLAKETGISHSCFNAWKKGEFEPSLKSLRKIAKYLEIDIKELI